MSYRRLFRGGLGGTAVAACASVCMLLGGAAPAGAVLASLPSGAHVSYQPLRGHQALLRGDAFFTNLDYSGGPVMPSNHNYTVYWDPSGAAKYPAGYTTGVDRYLEDLGADSGKTTNVDSVSAQYTGRAGERAAYNSSFAGAFVDTHPYPARGCTRAAICLTDEQIRAELVRFVKEHKLPMDLSHEYFLLTPEKVESCFESEGFECSAGVAEQEFAVYCAYHGDVRVPGGVLVYSNDPYVTGNFGCDDGDHPNGSPSDGAIQGGLSHEHNESVTDPEPNNAWTDWGANTGEIGDKCGQEFGAQLGEVEDPETKTLVAYNQVVNGHHYWYQEEWSNQKHACEQSLAFSGAEPHASFTAAATVEGGSVFSFDAKASTATGGVGHYSWQFNEGPAGTPSTPVETTTPTVEHTFATKGTHSVALTVYAKDGSSNGTVKAVFVGRASPIASFVLTTLAPSVGAPVEFDGSASEDPGGTIGSYLWEFGDGTSSAGAKPVHTYAAPGLYEVTLRVTGSGALASQVTQEILVTGPTVTSSAASGVASATATLNGSVNPGGSTVEACNFEYGPTAAYGATAPCSPSPGAGTAPVAVAASLSGLAASTTYHFRLTADGESVRSYGSDLTFTTAPSPGGEGGGGGGGGGPAGPGSPGGGSGGGGSSGAGGTTGGAAGVKPSPDAELAGTDLRASSAGVLALRISCPAAESACAGTATLATAATFKRPHGRPAIISIGVLSFKVSGGQTVLLHLRLRPMVRALLAHGRRLRVTVTIVAHDAAGATHSVRAAATIAAARRGH